LSILSEPLQRASEGLIFSSLRTLNFVTAYGRQNWSTALHLGKSFAVATSTLLPKLTPRGTLSFRNRASLFASRALRRMGVTHYPAATLRRQVFGLSSLILPTVGGCKIECPEQALIRVSKGPHALRQTRDAQFCSCLRQAKLAQLSNTSSTSVAHTKKLTSYRIYAKIKVEIVVLQFLAMNV